MRLSAGPVPDASHGAPLPGRLERPTPALPRVSRETVNPAAFLLPR